jgi:predicted nucleotidyltransferase
MSTGVEATGDLLFGQIRGRVLGLLYGHPQESFYLRQIARTTESSPGAVQRELESLSGIGLIERSVVGNQVFFRVNRSHPVYGEMRSLVAKTVGAFHRIRSALAPLEQRIALAFVYGSLASGEENSASDVDLMVIGDATLRDVLGRLATLESDIGREVNPTVYTASEFKKKMKAGNHFLQSVMDGEKVVLMGREDELGKVG